MPINGVKKGDKDNDVWRNLSMEEKGLAVGVSARTLFANQAAGCPIDAGLEAVLRWRERNVMPRHGGPQRRRSAADDVRRLVDEDLALLVDDAQPSAELDGALIEACRCLWHRVSVNRNRDSLEHFYRLVPELFPNLPPAVERHLLTWPDDESE